MAVVLKETGALIGSAGYWVDDEEDEAEYSIDCDFNPKFWHNGYAFEATGEVVRHLTDDLRVNEICGDCDVQNRTSAKLLEKLGFDLIKIVDWSYKDDADGNPMMTKAAVYRRIR